MRLALGRLKKSPAYKDMSLCQNRRTGSHPKSKYNQTPALYFRHTHMEWMTLNKLKLDGVKTEFIVFGSNHHMKIITTAKPTLIVGPSIIPAIHRVRNLGISFDARLSMDDHIIGHSPSRSLHVLPHADHQTCETLPRYRHAYKGSHVNGHTATRLLQLSSLWSPSEFSQEVATCTELRGASHFRHSQT